MNTDRDNPLEPLRNVKMTEEQEANILDGLRAGINDAEAARNVRVSGRRRRWKAYRSVTAGAAAVLVVGGTAWGLTQGHGKTGIELKQPPATKSHKNTNTPGFDETTDWNPSNSFTYASGLTAVTPPQVPEGPAAFEQSTASSKGIAEITVSKGTKASPDNWTKQIVFSTRTLRINGQDYTAPALSANEKLMVLPLASGMVWTGASQPASDLSKVKQMLNGNTAIYYTPYQPHGGSLTKGAEQIATLPHSWYGPDGPTVASAWTGWLSASDVTTPTVAQTTTYNLKFNQQYQLITAAPLQGAVTGWPTLYEQNLTKQSYEAKPPYAATVGSLTRTAGGFILQVSLQDATESGRNAGLTSADYYWSEKSGKWTPLTQSWVVQTVGGYFTAGSDAAYWIQPSPVGNGSGNELDATEMYFDPETLTIRSIWLGDWFYGPMYVDGQSLVTVLAGDMPKSANGKPTQWTVYTPDSAADTTANQAPFKSTLTLPNGQVLKPEQGAKWKNLNVQIQIQSLPQVPPGAPGYVEVMGNHSTILSHSSINTSAGPATLVLNERTPPAAAESTKATYEYWVIHYGSQYTYAIEAIVADTNLTQAKAEVMQLVNSWHVPK